ncbi:hypothetical protein PIROE2DRAFT_9690 [Piromyces sp. E2]|nr:hypothetical protein PIROE2DRAFT_9690 [Piromyces sp. E2]|eukprot:OUM63750.1 hypothetical protein PIROE2DRAFT_9690 [Piromyces sp. E2]
MVKNAKSYPRYCKDNPDDILCCMKTITTLGNGTEVSNKDCNVFTSEEYLKFYNDDIVKTVPKCTNIKYKSLFQSLKDSDPSQCTTDDSINNDTYEKYFNEMKENLKKLEIQLTTK